MDSKHNDTNTHIYLLLIAVVMVLVAVFGEIKNHALEQKGEYDLKPTAGIVTYLGSLQKHCFEYEPTTSELDILESNINTVAAYYADADEPEEPYDEEEVEEDGATGEDTGDDILQSCLIRYFGYAPSDDEITLWQRVVMAECGYTEPDAGVCAVADTIRNRIISERFPDTISDVVYQAGQFETVSNGAIWRYEVTDRVLEICSDCISEGPTYDYLFFTAGGYNPYCEPGEVIGNHYFGY